MIPIIPISKMDWNKKSKTLTLASEYFGMPAKFFVESHHTGRVVLFEPIGEDDPKFCQDQWDGEQMIYKPAASEAKTNAKYVVIYNQY